MEDTALDIQMHQLSTGQRAADYGFSALWAVDAAGSSYFAFLAASTGVGIPLAAAFGMNAVFAGDHAQASFREAWSGQVVDTYGVKGLTALTGSHQLAEDIDFSVMIASLATGFGAKGVSLPASRSLEDAALTDKVLASASHGGYNEVVTASKASSVLHAESSASRAGLFGVERAAQRVLSPLTQVLHDAKPTSGMVHQLETTLGDGTKIIFRRDVGEHAHPIGREYKNPVDHFNVEVHAPHPTRPGKFKPIQNMHVILDENLKPIDIILKNPNFARNEFTR